MHRSLQARRAFKAAANFFNLLGSRFASRKFIALRPVSPTQRWRLAAPATEQAGFDAVLTRFRPAFPALELTYQRLGPAPARLPPRSRRTHPLLPHRTDHHVLVNRDHARSS